MPKDRDRIITDEDCDKAAKMNEAAGKIIEALKEAPPEKRVAILRAASILSTGRDLHELDD